MAAQSSTSRRATSARTSPDSAPGNLVTLQAAAELLKVSPKTLRRRIADGTVTGYRVGRLIRVDLDELGRALVRAIPTRRTEARSERPVSPTVTGTEGRGS